MKNSSDKIKLILSMTIFGTIGILRRHIPYPSSVIALVRGSIGALFLILVHLLRKEKFPKEELKKNLLLLFLSGALIGANWICLFEAYRYTTVSVATVCYYMAPVFVVLASPFVLKEKLSLRKIICCCIALVGMIFVSGVIKTGLNGITGILFGLSAAIMYAIIIILNKFIKDLSANIRTMFQLGAAAITLLPYVLFTEDLSALTITPFLVLLLGIAGILHTGITYTLYFGSISRLPAQTVALFSYIDPIVAVLLSLILLKEPMSVPSAIGVILVLGATIISDLPDKSKK